MTKSRRFIVDFCNEIGFFFLVFGFCALITMALVSYYLLPFCAYVIAPSIIATFIFRLVAKSFVAFIVMNALFLLPLAFIPGPRKIIYIILTVIIVLRSFSIRLSDKKFMNFTIATAAALLGLNIAAWLLSEHLGHTELISFLFAGSLLIIICLFVTHHIERLDYSLEIITRTTTQPINHILSFNNFILAVFITIIIVAALMSLLIDSKGIVFGAGKAILEFIRYLVSIFYKGGSEPPPDLDSVSNIVSKRGGYFLGFGKTNPFFYFLDRILLFLVPIAFGAAILAALIYAIYRIYKIFTNTNANGDEVSFISSELIISSIIRTIRPSFLKLPSDKTRRTYIKKIKKLGKQTKTIIKDSDTASQIKEKMSPYEDISNLTEAYEKVRYHQDL